MPLIIDVFSAVAAIDKERIHTSEHHPCHLSVLQEPFAPTAEAIATTGHVVETMQIWQRPAQKP